MYIVCGCPTVKESSLFIIGLPWIVKHLISYNFRYQILAICWWYWSDREVCRAGAAEWSLPVTCWLEIRFTTTSSIPYSLKMRILPTTASLLTCILINISIPVQSLDPPKDNESKSAAKVNCCYCSQKQWLVTMCWPCLCSCPRAAPAPTWSPASRRGWSGPSAASWRAGTRPGRRSPARSTPPAR